MIKISKIFIINYQKKKEFKFIKKLVIGPVKLESNYFVNSHFNKKDNKKFPKIIYPYSPV